MKVEDVALQIYSAMLAREALQFSLSDEQREEMARRAFTYATEFIAVCQEEKDGGR